MAGQQCPFIFVSRTSCSCQVRSTSGLHRRSSSTHLYKRGISAKIATGFLDARVDVFADPAGGAAAVQSVAVSDHPVDGSTRLLYAVGGQPGVMVVDVTGGTAVNAAQAAAARQRVHRLTMTYRSAVRVTWGVGYLRDNFSLPRPLCSRIWPDVRDIQTSDRRQTRIIA